MKVLDIVICGLTISSSWGNGHATTWRALVRGLARHGHRVTFFERDVPWYAAHRDERPPEGCELVLYRDLEELVRHHGARIRDADAVIVGSYVPDGVELGRFVVRTALGVAAFYDIDTPVTLAKLSRGDYDYIDLSLMRQYDLYLSFTGGPVLDRLERRYGVKRAAPLYCSVDPERYLPDAAEVNIALGYLGTWCADRHAKLAALLLDVARVLPDQRFSVAGAGYADRSGWPANVAHREHVAPRDHAAFYGAQRLTLNITRADMVVAGYSPSVRLFEAAACGVPIATDQWEGLSDLFVPGEEVFVVTNTSDVVRLLETTDDKVRARVGGAARARVLAEHTADHRAAELIDHLVRTLDTSEELVAGGVP